MEVNVDVQVNRAVHTTEEGNFLSGQVYFSSTIATSMPLVIQDFIDNLSVEDATINLSRKGDNPNCIMAIHKLHAHDHHAPTFSSLGDMENYITRVMDRVTEVVQYMDKVAANWTSEEVE